MTIALVQRPWNEKRSIPVRLGTLDWLRSYAWRAARPTELVEEREDAYVFSLTIPGARASNTEIIWDAGARTLGVGVWASRRPGPRPRRIPPELAWYRAHWLPDGDGAQAIATVKRGAIEIVVPRLRLAAGLLRAA